MAGCVCTALRVASLAVICLVAPNVSAAAAEADAGAGQGAQPIDEKRVRVETAQTEPLELSLRAERSVLLVGEPIALELGVDRDAYLYLFSEDVRSGERRLLLPRTGDDAPRLIGGESIVMPQSGTRFVRDEPGRERITAIASVEPLDIEPLDEETRLAKAAFLSNRSDVSIAEIEIDVLGLPPGSAGTQPLVFVSSSCTHCRPGEPMRIGFGADRAGTVAVAVVEPDGSQSELVSMPVDGESLAYAMAMPETPAGRHTLVALWSPGPEPSEHLKAAADIVAQAVPGVGEKRVGLLGDGSSLPSYAVRHFLVMER